VAGLLYSGGLYNILLALFLVPFFITSKLMAARLRKILLKSEIEAESSRTLADRLNVALENMTHGIAMFNEEGGLVVMNDRFRELAKLSGWDAEKKPLSIVKPEVSEWSANKDLYQTLSNRLRSRHSARFRFKADKGHTLEADFNSMNNGGVVVISDITENVKAERVIRDLANFDPLTDLPNRRHFMEQMNNLKRQDGSLNECAMFFVDLDKFKEINDTLGHAVGDRLLQVVSERLRRLLPSDGLICRFGGDEFVLVVRDMQSQKDCQMFAEKIIAEMRAVFVVSTHRLNIAASVGIAIAPEQGTNAEELLQRTDAALYKAKGNGRSTFVFFTEELGSTLRERSQLEKDLKIAIEDESIEVYFQPLINLKRGRISTCEALSRWEHSEFGRVSPEVFIRIAEEAGMIADLGHYVLKRSMVMHLNGQSMCVLP
jgi:diguanylate cyclase (GGDEF)-like protein